MSVRSIQPWTMGGSWVYTTYLAAVLRNITARPNGSNQSEFQTVNTRKQHIDVADLLDRVTSLYTGVPTKERYNHLLIGPPNGGMVYLATRFKCPYLPTDLFLPIQIGCDPDSLVCHLEALHTFSRVIQGCDDIEVIGHFDPIHDRVDIGKILHTRLKFSSIPKQYKQFITDNLSANGTIVVVQCDFSWKQFELDDRVFFQLGGFGAISPDEYVTGSERIDHWLATQWTSHRGGWGNAGYEPRTRQESEWGSPPEFADHVREFCDLNGYEFLKIEVDHPSQIGIIESQLRMEESNFSSPERIVVEAYWAMNPNLSLRTNCIPIWIPYIDSNTFHYCRGYLEYIFRTLRSDPSSEIIMGYPWSLPTLDIMAPREWLGMLASYAPAGVSLPGVGNLDNPMDADSSRYIDITNTKVGTSLPGLNRKSSIAALKKVYEKVVSEIPSTLARIAHD